MAKAISAEVVNSHLNTLAVGNRLIYSSMASTPTTYAGITGILCTRTLVPSSVGNENSDYSFVSGVSMTIKPGVPLESLATETARTIVLAYVDEATPANNKILLVDTGSSPLVGGVSYTPNGFTYTFNQPV